MRAKKLATATKSVRLYTATAPTNGQALICEDASGDEIIAAWGNPGSVTTTAPALTDNSGGGAADGTIGAVTAPTALTDNGGGTADGTVASLAAATTLTDSTGLSGTHDDTLAATTVPGALTVSDGVGTNDGTIGAITDNATTIAAVQELAAKINATLTLLGVMAQNESDVAQKIIELVTWQATVQSNFKELTTAQSQNRAAIVALTDAIKEITTAYNQLRSDIAT